MINPYLPVAPCGSGCVAGKPATVSWLRVTARFVVVISMLLLALCTSPVLFVLRECPRQRYVKWLFGRLISAFGARLEVHGDTAFGSDFGANPGQGERDDASYEKRGALVVNNHVSWLDVVAVNAVHPMRALGKSEIARWPVIGWLAKVAGTIFLRRDELSTLPGTIAEVTKALRAGSLISVTPEATTWCGLASGHFRPATFQAAIDGGVPVLPIAVRYRLEDGTPTTWPAFIGDDTLLDSMLRAGRLRGLVVELHVLDEIAPGRAADRRELAVITERAMRAVLDDGRAEVPMARQHPIKELRPE
ncbi:lysophospholipid acyltransferase family protein [Sciscionella marina]|uniref:lysophospholipid acyltransferase family protein n=1 Tax=Sciscionella marina TaxID=508770 RepID=UPI0003A25B8D|nr:lysophospholipid acyltransferase family protein [Sciscionella marina]